MIYDLLYKFINKKKAVLNEANPNFWTDLKLYGLSSVFYRAQAN